MIEPFVKMFCLARNLFEGVSSTFVIFAIFVFLLSVMFAVFIEREMVLSAPPRVFFVFTFLSPSFVSVCFPRCSKDFFFLAFLYFPPVDFLPRFIYELGNLGLLRFWGWFVGLGEVWRGGCWVFGWGVLV